MAQFVWDHLGSGTILDRSRQHAYPRFALSSSSAADTEAAIQRKDSKDREPNPAADIARGSMESASTPKRVRTAGSGCIWPRGLRERYDISGPTLWRWERNGKLPRRDVFIGGRAVGWRPETIARAESGRP